MKDVHLYNLRSHASYNSEFRSIPTIGRMLIDVNSQLGNADLILQKIRRRVVLVRLDGRVYDFGYFPPNLCQDTFKTIPGEAYWSVLSDRVTVPVRAEDVLAYAAKLEITRESVCESKITARMVAEKLLESRLEEKEKDVAIFTGDRNKLAVIARGTETIKEEVQSFDYRELASRLG